MLAEISKAISRTISIIDSKKLTEVAVTDISSCLRASYYSFVYGKAPTEKMLIGLDNHAYFARHLSRVISDMYGVQCVEEYDVEYGSVKGRIDLMCTGEHNFIIELKFTSLPNESNVFVKAYERQLKYYMAITGIKRGYLVMMSFDFSKHKVVEYIIDDKERERLLREIEDRATTLLKSKQLQYPPPYEKDAWCGMCKWKNECFNVKLA